MANRERPRDRGARIGHEQLVRLGREAREARIGAGLTQRAVADRAGIHRSWVGRFELGKADGITFQVVAILLGLVGLDLSAKAYPGADPMRDRGHARLIARFLGILPEAIGRALEVPFPMPGDPRAWDIRLRIGRGAWGVEAETHVTDVQATLRRISLKRRDGEVDGIVMLLADTLHHRQLLRDYRGILMGTFPCDRASAIACLTAGRAPEADSIILL